MGDRFSANEEEPAGFRKTSRWSWSYRCFERLLQKRIPLFDGGLLREVLHAKSKLLSEFIEMCGF